jgi:hypothetical protein
MKRFRLRQGKYILACVFVFVICTIRTHAQTPTDTLPTVVEAHKKKRSIFAGRPGKSMLMSLVVPGTGQIYNKSYWRLPFVYAAVGGMGYVLHYNTIQYTCLRDAYIASIDMVDYDPPSNCPKITRDFLARTTNPATIRLARDEANANRQLTIVGFALVWLANGIDAYVDAHLKDFDVDDDLSIHLGPRVVDDPLAPYRVGVFVTIQ